MEWKRKCIEEIREIRRGITGVIIINKFISYYYFSYNQCIQLDYKYTHAWNGKGACIVCNLGRYEEAL